MAKLPVYNLKNEEIEQIEIPADFSEAKWNQELVFQVLFSQQSNSRNVVAHAKGRGEVRGGGKKPWKQKGTGRARHGSIRSPLWIGGGVTHGPLKDKNYTKKINKKMKKLAIFSVLSKKIKDGDVKLVLGLDLVKDLSKTKNVLKDLKNFINLKSTNLFVLSEKNKKMALGLRNISKTSYLSPKSLNVFDLLRPKNIIIEKDAVGEIISHYSK